MENEFSEQQTSASESMLGKTVELPTPELKNEQRVLALCTYLVPLVSNSNFIAPLIIWLLKKDQDVYIERHAKESLNFQITFAILGIIAWVSIFMVVGFILFPAVIITYIVFSVIACVKAQKGEEYSIPICIRLIK